MRDNWCWYDYQAGRAVENDVDGSEPDEEEFNMLDDEDEPDESTQEDSENNG